MPFTFHMFAKSYLLLTLGTAAGLALTGCASSTPAATATSTTPATATASATTETAAKGPVLPGVGLDLSARDMSVSPCEDFFQYASGTWVKNTPIPAAESSWGSWNTLIDQNNAVLRQILESSAANKSAAKGSNAQKVGDFYASAMDTVAIEKAGLKYLQPELARINGVKDLKGLQTQLVRQQMLQTRSVFGLGVRQDSKKSTEYAVYMGQGGLTLPDRDYYLKDDARSKTIRTAYTTYLTNMFKMLGDNEATASKNAATVLRLETRLAKASKDRVALRDRYANYNKMTVAEANAQFPNIGLTAMLPQVGLGSVKEVIVGQPEFMKEASAALKQEPIGDWKTYMRFHLVNSVASALPKAYVDESFRFNQVMSGAKQQQPRWKRMLRSTDATLGEAFGQIYVEKAFTPETKKKALEMVANIKEAMGEHIQALEWMSPATKQEAMKKLNGFTVKIGYPDKWKDYSALTISRESYLKNVLAAREWEFKDNVSKFGKPIDRTEWGMTPPTVNAYYNSTMNEIVFPAGIMQPPFFDPKADDAVNYGGMGAVIGHEITHGFDDQGRQSDAEGNLRDWWTKEDAAEFSKRTDLVGKQYSAFSPLDSVYVNGKLTMGENLADFGGTALAYSALQKQLQKQYGSSPRPQYDGLTPEQRFFLAWAQVWRTSMRPEALRQQVLTDPHSPAQYRTNGPLMNMPEFYEAFGCKEDAKMVRAQNVRARVW
ncbi:M13 family metallopeptidase [Hymenobacter mucosus]|uniref:Endothelin-converting enzyme Metallo peptidase. MEROPS family M13 n=1 Tax=Hymenobacter mucosus TaxID=1411120 RepID=A0A238WXC0_9BACT|nr:M13 family metallopeptidase [Hymenobacter mucosus]SNR50991.1 endothelin-converting enzyme Metallo peptidase. MEROPS family M13 [Hymenobacter mucosus]